MAVTQPSHAPQIKEYWPRYRQRVVVMVVATQMTSAILLAGALCMIGLPPATLHFWLILLIVLVISLPLNVFLTLQLLTPLKDLADALSHVAGEPSTIIPPNPAAPHFGYSGFKPLLQYIYQSAVVAKQTPPRNKTLKQLQDALTQTSAGIVLMDEDGRIIYANPNTPLTKDRSGQNHLELLFDPHDNLTNWLAKCRDQSVRAEKTWLRVATKLVGQPDRRIFDITANYEKGSAAEVIIVMHDRTSLYQPEDDDLDFIAFAAHELRGPITVIRGYLDVFNEEIGPSLNAEYRQLIQRLIVSANRLSSYINNILNASKFDRRHLRIHLAETTVAAVYDTIRDDMQLRAQAQHRQLNVTLSDTLPTIAADRSSLSEVLSNLIDNALKYSHEDGVVTVSAKTKGNFVEISVQDYGIGIPANLMSHLFHKFYRSHRSRETVAGTGIGLYISKAIVESHGGQISVTSHEGEGSTFTISIPIYATVANKIRNTDGSNEDIISHNASWIKNHTMYKG